MIFATCPICNFSFEDDEDIDLGFNEKKGYNEVKLKEDGECPNCKAHYVIDYDFPNNPESAILIADFDYYYMKDEEKKIEKEKRLTIIKKQ